MLLDAQVPYDRLVRSTQEPQNWLTHSGNYNSQRYSTLSQITTENVNNLELRWIFQTRSLEKFEATPLVVDGILYTVEAPNNVVALDAATGASSGRLLTRRRKRHVRAAAASIAVSRFWATRYSWRPLTPD